jgi:hypothetical protein
MGSRCIVIWAFILAWVGPLAAQEASSPPPPCDADSVYHVLDFWVGDWDVKVGSELVGTNRVSRILQGCAVVEEWKDVEGGEGRSLFYYDPTIRRWKQVWVTSQATATGGTKEKRLVARLPNGGTRFQGEISLPRGGVLLDRTTLEPRPDGSVRQLIEVSRDGGTTWHAAFDAIYQRKKG